MKQFLKRLLFLSFALSGHQMQAQTHVFAQLKGTPVNTEGWRFMGDAGMNNPGIAASDEIVLCKAKNGMSGAVFFHQPVNLSSCKKWKAEFDFRMYDGTGADGIAFCFLDVPPSGFVTGGGIGIPAKANGLKICFDTWNNCGAPTPKIQLRWGAGYDGECSSQPTLDNSTGRLSFLRSSKFNHALVTYDSGNIKVFVNDSLYLTGFQQFNFAGYPGFTSSTGGATDNHSIKNVVIYTEMPPSEAGPPSVKICPGDSIQLGTTSDDKLRYLWTPSIGLNKNDIADPKGSLQNNGTVAIEHTYYVRTAFKDNPGCFSIDSVVVHVAPFPVIYVTEQSVVEGTSTTLNASVSGGSSFNYQWQPLNGLNNGSILQPSVSTSNETTYTLTAINEEGCSSTGRVRVKVLRKPNIPNAFSPNRDNIHDKWIIPHLVAYVDCRVEVFNRFGQKVFTSKGYAQPWDGTMNGNPLPMGTYYYVIDVKRDGKIYTGSVTLLR